MIFKKENSRSDKKQIWMYAVVLFAGAFIILLLTAYSQVKFQNNISDYQSKLTTKDKEKINAMNDLNSAVKENKRLTEENASLKSELLNNEQKLKLAEESSSNFQQKYNKLSGAMDSMLIADEYYQNGDIINCALTLKYDIDTQNFSIKAAQHYNELVNKTFSKASYKLYKLGQSNYRKKEYIQAVLNLENAIHLSSNSENYIDDCYYYIAKSYYKNNDFVKAKDAINNYITNYPGGRYVGELKTILDKIK